MHRIGKPKKTRGNLFYYCKIRPIQHRNRVFRSKKKLKGQKISITERKEGWIN